RPARLLLRLLSHQGEADRIEVVVRYFLEQLLGLRGIARALRRHRELILDVRIEGVALPQMSGCLLILALIKRDESLQLVHRLELPRVRVGLEQLADAVRLRLGGLVVAPARGPPPLEVGDLRLLPARNAGLPASSAC